MRAPCSPNTSGSTNYTHTQTRAGTHVCTPASCTHTNTQAPFMLTTELPVPFSGAQGSAVTHRRAPHELPFPVLSQSLSLLQSSVRPSPPQLGWGPPVGSRCPASLRPCTCSHCGPPSCPHREIVTAFDAEPHPLGLSQPQGLEHSRCSVNTN